MATIATEGTGTLRNQRRLVSLDNFPLLQLKLPMLLLLATGAFSLLFAVHTRAAYGELVSVGFDEPWIRGLAAELRYDYLVVSVSIGLMYIFFVLGTCLAGTHRLLGPIVAIERHVDRLQGGDYTARVRLRAGHPLRNLADDLNGLTDRLQSMEPAHPDSYAFVEEGDLLDPRAEQSDKTARTETPVATEGASASGVPWRDWYPSTATRV